MRGRRTALALASLAQAAGGAVFLGLPVLAPQFGAAYGADLGQIAFLLTAITLAAGLAVLPWGALADLVGERRVMACGLAVASVGLALGAVAERLPPLVAALALAGAGASGTTAASARSVLGWFAPGQRGVAMGIRQSALPAGAAAGALSLPALAAGLGVGGALLGLSGACLLVAAALLAMPDPPPRHPAEPSSSRGARPLADPRIRRVVATSALLAISQIGMGSFIVVFLHAERGWDLAAAASLVAAVQVLSAAARIGLGRWSDSGPSPVRPLRAVALSAGAALLALAAVAGDPGPAVVPLLIVAGLLSSSWNGLASLATGELADPERAGRALAWQATAVFLGGAVATPAVAALVSAASWPTAFAALALPAFLAAAVVAPLQRSPDRAELDPPELLWRALSTSTSAISLIDVRDPAMPFVYTNEAFPRLTGYSSDEAAGRPWQLLEGPETDPAMSAELARAVGEGESRRERIRHHRRDGTAFWSELFLSPIPDENGVVTHYMGVQKDVSARVEEERLAAHLAYHDTLTGLPNRAQFEERLQVALARANRTSTGLGLLFLDLDGFKAVNDEHGHGGGDRLLRALVRRWAALTRETDTLARYGGDEFLLLLTDLDPVDAEGSAVLAAERCIQALGPGLRLPGSGAPTTVGVSVGIALHPCDGQSAAELVLASDAAMYAAKRAGGNRWRRRADDLGEPRAMSGAGAER